MTEEFRNNYDIDLQFPSLVLDNLEDFVYSKFPYSLKFDLRGIYAFPTVDDVVNSRNSDCRGRAIVGYCILKNLGYDDVYIVGSFTGHHVWLRIYLDEVYYEDFLVPGCRDILVMFNEEKVIWTSPFEELPYIFLTGVYQQDYLIAYYPDFIRNFYNATGINFIDVLSPLPFIIPVFATCIFTCLTRGETRIKKHLLILVGGLVVVIISGYSCVILTRFLLILPIAFMSGIYIRVVNWKIMKESGQC
ncbi:MAG TPA: hypothetical protein ENI49_04635 [Thermoplasmatales archaeon]|nr:hypothetical protein [Thermoplasmatales archaeon]